MKTDLTVTSKDGTKIAVSRMGSGPALVCVDGAFCSRSFGPMGKLAPLVASHFTVHWYDRRGRGQSGDTAPYACEREVEDVAAVVDAAGGAAFLYGSSSGAMLAARAAASGVRALGLAMHEPPLALDGTHVPSPADYREQIATFIKADRKSDAVKLFMQVVGVPAPVIFMMRVMPGAWSGLKSVVHTLPYDFAVLGDTQHGGALPSELVALFAAIRAPTVLLAGTKSGPWMHHAAKRVAETIGNGAHVVTLQGQDHNVAGKAVAPVLIDAFGARAQRAA